MYHRDMRNKPRKKNIFSYTCDFSKSDFQVLYISATQKFLEKNQSIYCIKLEDSMCQKSITLDIIIFILYNLDTRVCSFMLLK